MKVGIALGYNHGIKKIEPRNIDYLSVFCVAFTCHPVNKRDQRRHNRDA